MNIPDPGAITNWLFLIALVSGGATAIYKVIKKVEQAMVIVEERTAPIQKDANGGSSLADANRRLEKIDSSVNRVHERIDEVHGRITDLAVHVGELRGEFNAHTHPQGGSKRPTPKV